MLSLLVSSRILSCPHNKMVLELIQVLYKYRLIKRYTKSDSLEIIGQVLDFIKQRCKQEELVETYQLMVLPKIKLAFNIVVSSDKMPEISEEDRANFLDIDIEEFGELKIDDEFDKLMGNNG
jgi:hypothetical protein